MNEYLISFFEEFNYPEEARQVLGEAYKAISENKDAMELFNNSFPKVGGDLFPMLDQVAEITGIHKYTVHLLYFICLSKSTREVYKERNIPYQVFYDSVSDLKWKLMECYKVYGIWGSFVAWWFNRFYNLTRFALGRLQFETVELRQDYENEKVSLKKGDTVINVHIPSAGPLTRDECMKSYKAASEFFAEYFVNRPTVFVCDSWLLFPKHREFLPKHSNILTFMDDYDIVESSETDNFEVLWRIFNKPYTGSVDDLPSDTSLQRAYKDWISKGNLIGNGYGVFVFAVTSKNH